MVNIWIPCQIPRKSSPTQRSGDSQNLQSEPSSLRKEPGSVSGLSLAVENLLFFFTGLHTDYHTPKDIWKLINAKGEKSSNLISSIENNYNNGCTDEFIKPIIKVAMK